MSDLPAHRRIVNGRTQSSVWDPAEYGAAIRIYRPSLIRRFIAWMYR